jgi:uncharacterized membrane protein (TIGR01666 family)
MLRPLDNFRNFLYTQYFSDGIKITIGVLLPSLLFFNLDMIEVGMTLSIGAVCSSIADSPGPWIHRRNAMLITNGIASIIAIITGFLNHNPVFIGIEILVVCFFFSMFHVYGTRASSVGTAAIFIMILNVDPHQSELKYLELAGLILCGGFWYFLLSMLFSTLLPYRYAQQTLGECIQEIARYMRLRASFYNDKVEVEKIFKDLVDKQVIVHELQDNVREVLFKTRKLVNDSTNAGRLLVVIFADMVDLFEQTMATHHDYDIIRKRYKNYDILPSFALLIHKLSSEIEYIGFCLIHQVEPRKHSLTMQDLDDLKLRLDELENEGVQVLILKKIIINLRHIFTRTNVIFGYFDDETFKHQPKSEISDRTKFVNHQSFDFKLLKNNLNLESGTFRYALRLAIVAFIGYVIGNLLPVGHHSYWIVLTIMVILKPGFSMTKQRNYERAIGTIIGGVSGALLLYFIHDENARFVLMVLFMIITYSTQRVFYFISVIFMTPFILILFSFIGTTADENIAMERVLDTLIGSGIAFVSSYIILPSWESYQIKQYMSDMLKANLKYLESIYARLANDKFTITEYKLARKEVYVKTANLAAAFQRMLNEPKAKQHRAAEVHKFVVLNHVLSSYLANLSSSLLDNELVLNAEQKKFFNKSTFYLKESILFIDDFLSYKEKEHVKNQHPSLEKTSDDLITEQLELIAKLSADILKVTEKLYN